jgi:DNA-binding transcriptional MocR family regulator
MKARQKQFTAPDRACRARNTNQGVIIMKKEIFAKRTIEAAQAGIADAFAASNNTELISFAGGFPDAQLFPNDEMGESFRQAFTENSLNVLQYHDNRGYAKLRQILAKRLTADGTNTSADDIILTQGAQQAIDLVARMLINPGDGLVVEAPTYFGALGAFDAYDPTYYEIPMDADGMNMHALQKVLMAHSVKMIYTIPDFQNPTGAVMSLAKRQELIRLANQYDVVVLEDSPYRWLRFSGKQLPTLRSLDTEDRVISLGSFSKILAPGLRLGWATGGQKWIDAIATLKNGADLESPFITMVAVANYLSNNDLDAHLATLRKIYASKKNAMVAALQENLPNGFTVNNPQGGFFVWLQAPAGVDMGQIMKADITPNEGVAYIPSQNLYPSKTVCNAARLNFTGEDIPTIQKGIARLSKALQKYAPAVPAAALS